MADQTVDVVWLSYRQPDIAARGYWDEQLLEDLMAPVRSWRTVPSRRYLHHDTTADVPRGNGAIVVLPGQHHADRRSVLRLNHDLERLAWVLLVVAGDECSLFPVDAVRHPNLRLWVMTPQWRLHGQLSYPSHDRSRQAARFIGEGYGAEARARCARRAHTDASAPRSLAWYFAGQITHERRSELIDALCGMDGGMVIPTGGFLQGDRDDYWGGLLDSMVAPAPSGACTVDSFRLYEALEAGCVPVVEHRAPDPHAGDSFWHLLYGTTPFPIVNDWSDLPAIVEDVVGTWPAPANRCSVWWQQRKRELAYWLADDVDALSGAHFDPKAPDDMVTAIVTTSPTPAHPSTEMLEQTVASVRHHFPGCEIVIAFDGVRPEQENRRAAYEAYQQRALWLCNHVWRNVVPVRMDHHAHQANTARAALELVRTPCVLFMEHDTPLVTDEPIEWRPIFEALGMGVANLVRLHHEALVLDVHQHLMLDRAPPIEDFPALRTVQWSQRPHIASTRFYRELLGTYFGTESRTMIEDVMHGVVDFAWRERGEDGWAEFRLWLYAPAGNNIKRSLHLDGRGDDPKFDMRFAYDGATPRGAPRATAERVD